MKKFSLKEYAESKTSAPELIGDISTEYGKNQIKAIAEFNGLTETLIANEYATVEPFSVDHRVAAALCFIRDTLAANGADCYATECGEVYATKAGLNYSYLDNHVDDVMWNEISSYGEEEAENE